MIMGTDAERINAIRQQVIETMERAAAKAPLTPIDRGQLRALKRYATPEQVARIEALIDPPVTTQNTTADQSAAYERGLRRAREEARRGSASTSMPGQTRYFACCPGQNPAWISDRFPYTTDAPGP
jgi:hypothetical protein